MLSKEFGLSKKNVNPYGKENSKIARLINLREFDLLSKLIMKLEIYYAQGAVLHQFDPGFVLQKPLNLL